MELNYDYYFRNYEDNDIFKELLKNVDKVWQIRENAKRYLKTGN